MSAPREPESETAAALKEPESPPTGAGKLPHSPAMIDEQCITMAKAWFAGESRLARGKELMNAVQVRMISNIVINFADHGNMLEAERYMGKMDGRLGYTPDIRAINSLIRGYMASSDTDAAYEWFKKTLEPQLYPELGEIRPNSGTFHYMIVPCAARGLLVARAEKCMLDMERFDLLPTLAMYAALIRGCVEMEPPQAFRGHRWCEVMLEKGTAEVPGGFAAADVKQERTHQKMTGLFNWNLDFFDRIIQGLARDLADAGNAMSADRWLAYLVDTGLSPETASATWEHVRAAHPKEIIPTLLSCERSALLCGGGGATARSGVGAAISPSSPLSRRGAPSLAVPARLAGETHHARPDRGAARAQEAPLALTAPIARATSRRLASLNDAIAEGEAAGLPEKELRRYKAAVAVEERAVAARALLKQALLDGGSQAALAEAVQTGEAAGLGEDELGVARAALEQEQRKVQARASLEEALRRREAVEETLLPPLLQRPSAEPLASRGPHRTPRTPRTLRKRADVLGQLKLSARTLYV